MTEKVFIFYFWAEGTSVGEDLKDFPNFFLKQVWVMPTRGRLGTRVFLSECDRVRDSSKRAGGTMFFYAPRSNCVGTTSIWASRSVQGPVPAMTSHVVMTYDIIIGCLKIWASWL